MRVNSFSLLVPEGRERDSGHVELSHNTVYTVRLGNHDNNRDCDATVSVDGKPIGAFRVRAGTTMTLERPAHDTGRFTFFESSSQQAQDAGVTKVEKDMRGLVEVVFRPEKQRRPSTDTKNCGFFGHVRSAELRSRGFESEVKTSGGITGLTGKSAQGFHEVPNLDYEPNAEVTITLRLVRGISVRELTPAEPRSNPIPRSVE